MDSQATMHVKIYEEYGDQHKMLILMFGYAESQKHLAVEMILKKHKREKKRAYNNCIMNVEHGNSHH